jgi:hypothetical protein
MPLDLAPYQDGIPVVANTTSRDQRFPNPADDQRVFNKAVGNTQRYSVALGGWVVDTPLPVFTVTSPLYGAKGDGVTDDAIAINAAVAAARAAGGGVVYFPQPSVKYLTLTPINCTVGSGVTSPSLIFRGDFGQNANAPLIYGKHTGHVFDLAGATDFVFENITVAGDTTTVPKTGWFLARNAAGSGAGRHRFVNCRSSGYFSVAVVYSYGSEENEFQGCWLQNSAPNADTVIVTGYNNSSTNASAPLTSSFITIATGAQSMVTMNVWGGSYFCAGGTANVFNLDGVSGINIYGSWMYAAQSNVNGHALVNFNTTNSASVYCHFDGIIGEQGGTYWQNYGFYFGGSASTVACAGISITNCRLPTHTFAVYGDAHCTFDSCHMDNLAEPTAQGVSVLNFNNSYFKGVNNLFVVRGSLDKSVLIGNSVGWTIASKTNYIFLDTTTGKVINSAGYDFGSSTHSAQTLPNTVLSDYATNTFTPALAIGAGAPTSYSAQVASYTKIGNRLFFDIYVAVNVLGAATGAVSVTGLPFPATTNTSENFAVSLKIDGSKLSAGQYTGYVAPGGQTVFIQIMAFGTPTTNTNMAETNLANSTSIMISGSYRV